MTKALPLKRWKVLGYRPNDWAYNNVHAHPAKFKTATTARQVGKTTAGAIEIDEGLTEPEESLRKKMGLPRTMPVPKAHVGLLAPTYDKAELMVTMWIEMVTKAFGENYYQANWNKHTLVIRATGERLTWLSCDNPRSVIGFTFSKLIIDESQDVPDEVIELIDPALAVRDADIIAFGTPDINEVQTWFYGHYMLGQDEDQPDYHSFNVAASENRWMGMDRILRAKKRLTKTRFAQLYLGQWVNVGGQFFKNFSNAVLGAAPLYDPGKNYILSVDFGIHEDSTVVIVGERATRTAVHMERWDDTDPLTTYDRIVRIWEKYGKPRVVADESGMGEPMCWELRERGMKVMGVKFTPKNKLPIYRRLAGDLEHRRTMFPGWEVMINELKGFVYKRTRGGMLTAGAAAGYHDDCVASLALLNEGFRMAGGRGSQEQYNYLDHEDETGWDSTIRSRIRNAR